VTWTLRNGTRYFQCVASSADGTKLVAGGLSSWQLYTSSDSGATWTQRTAPGISDQWMSVASSADGTKLVAAANGSGIYTSTDSGVTWTQQNIVSGQWRSVASSADGTKLVAGNCGVPSFISSSTNSGVTWTPQNIGAGRCRGCNNALACRASRWGRFARQTGRCIEKAAHSS
jgi:photosystem II stability/assembly factor-like uncharacterized protein